MKSKTRSELVIEPVHYSTLSRLGDCPVSPYKQPDLSRLELRQQLLDDLESLNVYNTKISFYTRYKRYLRVSLLCVILASLTALLLVLFYPRQLQMSIKGSVLSRQLRLETYNPNLYPVYITNLQMKVMMDKVEVEKKSLTLERYLDSKLKFYTDLDVNATRFPKGNDSSEENWLVKVKLDIPVFKMIRVKEPTANFVFKA